MMPSVVIDAKGMHYTPLNQLIRNAVADGAKEIVIRNVMGQRFIGDGLTGDATIILEGVPGGDLGMFMKGPTIIVHGNADHAPGNTMDSGLIIIHGSSGDATAHSMRGGRVYVRDDIGYRGGIHMKQYKDKRPVLIIGGNARAFLGEYIAGGLIIMLRSGEERPELFTEMGIASGIHGGEIFIRGEVAGWALGIGSAARPAASEEILSIKEYITEFCEQFGFDSKKILGSSFTRIAPVSARPFANKYTWE
jgi:glutamate synthase domain-containing protein 3